MLVRIYDLHIDEPGGNLAAASGSCQINRNEKPLPCWPTTRPRRGFPEAVAWASSRPTILAFWDRPPFLPCPPRSPCRYIRSIRRGSRLSDRWNSFEYCNAGSCRAPPATPLRGISYKLPETLALL